MTVIPSRKSSVIAAVALVAAFGWALSGPAAAQAPFSAEDVFRLGYASSAEISPDGEWIAYTVSRPRAVDDDAGGRYSELYVVSTRDGAIRPFVTGKVNVGGVRWTPDSKAVSFLLERGEKAKRQVWTIHIDGGEALQTTSSKSNVITYRWHPAGDRIAYTAVVPKSKREKKLDEKGYDFIYYEEDWKHRNLYIADVENLTVKGEPKQLTDDITVWSFEFAPDGNHVAFTGSDKNLIDYRYMFEHIYLLDPATGDYAQFSRNPGKLGSYEFSPKGDYIAYTAALTQNDNAVSQVLVQALDASDAVNLTPADFAGQAYWAGWKDNNTVIYVAGEGVWNTLSTVKRTGGRRNVILHSQNTGVVFGTPSYTKGFKKVAFTASSPTDPPDVYYWRGSGKLERLTKLNPWVTDRDLGEQEVISFPTRDGLELQGLLCYPLEYQPGRRYPLIVQVHGGPESHYRNDWSTYYSRPVQVLNGGGYFVFLPNYRSSTGYGVELPMSTLGDPAGKEFDDIADGIQHLIDQGMVDPERVGLGGGSYGGYAAAWFSTYYTDLVKAVVMFVGISDVISKRGTTDIPWEELYVHSGKKLEDMWQIDLERSPIYYGHQSETATLILGGTSDTRVHPSQSLEMYRRLKMNDHPAVRLVRYPGEGHGNRKMPGRRDVCLRMLQWYDWYVKDAKPIDGPMPPYDISDQYGLELPEDD
jgi:dipeptidyl aminopeptidase/acylaminoacyl peptidase